MDFCQLLHKAQKNDKSSSNGIRYYSTKFEPPKKIKKESKELSNNIKKFLAKKEAEEQQKNAEAKKKKDDLLALRAQDKQATRRVNVMLKRTKSANQSVIEDAVDNTHTAVTLAGPDQPDEDDYGYVSQEATALYEKMMEKYSKMPEEKKFDPFKKKVSTNLTSTKDRVKAALEKEKEEAMQPHRRKRKRKEHEDTEKSTIKNDGSPERNDSNNTSKESKVELPKPKPKARPAPPPMSFNDLLKMAEKKQFEPIVIEQKAKEEEKPLTKKQKREQEKEREWREKREARQKEMENRERIEMEKEKNGEKGISKSKNGSRVDSKGNSPGKLLEKQLTKTPSKDNKNKQVPPFKNTLLPSSAGSQKIIANNEESKKTPSKMQESKVLKENPLSSKNSTLKPSPYKSVQQGPSGSSKNGLSIAKDAARSNVASGKLVGKPKEFPPRDVIPKGKPKEFPPRDVKPKQFPPPDVRGFKRPKPMQANKGRILDDSEEEYNSELDDFIDDGPEEDQGYSSYIKEIFGYDKSKYRDFDDDDDNMESSFAQQMKEEVISAKIGIKEDLEDMKLEEEQKRRKAMLKKKMKR